MSSTTIEGRTSAAVDNIIVFFSILLYSAHSNSDETVRWKSHILCFAAVSETVVRQINSDEFILYNIFSI